MVKRPDDNARAQAGEVWDAFDDLEPVEAPPASGPVRRLGSRAEGTAGIRAALRSLAGLATIRSTTGAGKSAELRDWLAERAPGEGRVALFVPTHQLGEQVQDGLGRLGVASARPVGVVRVRLPVVGGGDKPACLHHEAANDLARAGESARRVLCSECSARERHPETGGECPAYAAGTSKAGVVVLQQALLAPALDSATADLERGGASSGENGGPVCGMALDESPPLVLHTSLAGAGREYQRARLAGELRPEVRERLEPMLFAVLAAVKGGAVEGETLRGLLLRAGETPAAIEAMLSGARELDGEKPWRDLPARLGRRAMRPATHEDARGRLKTVARFSELLGALVNAAHAPDAPLLWLGEGGEAHLATLARWVRVLPRYIAAGGRVRLLDATAPLEALQAVWGGGFEEHTIDVQDAPGVERRFLVWNHGARGRHAPGGQVSADELRGPLRRLAALAAERRARSVGIIAHRPVAEAIQAWLAAAPGLPAPAWCPDELAALVAGGAGLVVGHYGSQRGLDTWAECDVLATLGDPWPNLGAARAEGRALGVDPEGWALEQVRAELVQAWGRARTVHRTSPVLVVHLGSEKLAPDASWAPQWAGVRPERAARGRPRSVSLPALGLSPPSTWAGERERLGLSARAHARALGLSQTTYIKRELEALGGTEAGRLTEPQENPCEVVNHNPPLLVSSDVSGDPEGRSSLIPDYGSPETPGFPPSEPSALDAPGGLASEHNRGRPRRPKPPARRGPARHLPGAGSAAPVDGWPGAPGVAAGAAGGAGGVARPSAPRAA